MMISVAGVDAGEGIAHDSVEGRPGVDAVGLRAALPLTTKVSPAATFCAAVDDVTAIGRSRRIGVPHDGVVSGIAVDGVSAGVQACIVALIVQLSM